MEYKKYQGKEFIIYKPSYLYELYKTYCTQNKYESFPFDQFESKIAEKENNGIIKGLFHKSKVYRFYKDDFEEYIKSFNILEDLYDMTEELSMCDESFIIDN